MEAPLVEALLTGVFFLAETFLAKAPLTEKHLEKNPPEGGVNNGNPFW